MITDELATLVESIINDRLTVTTFDGYYEVDNAGEIARAALEAVLPMIRDAVLEDAAKGQQVTVWRFHVTEVTAYGMAKRDIATALETIAEGANDE